MKGFEIINDFIIHKHELEWCGNLFKYRGHSIWVFKNRPHGYDVTFGKTGAATGRNWDKP